MGIKTWTRLVTFLAVVLLLPHYFPAVQAQQIIPGEELEKIRGLLPVLDSPEFQGYLEDPTTLYYTSQTMGVYYQQGSSRSANRSPIGFHNALHNVSADGNTAEPKKGNGRGGNLNTSTHFPWAVTAGGMHRSANTDNFKALWLPKQADGQPWPVVWYRTAIEGMFHPDGPSSNRGRRKPIGYNWTFPTGAVLLEALVLRHPETNESYAFELRFRIREPDQWGVELFRPFPTAASLAEAIQDARPNWEGDEQLADFITRLHDDDTITPVRITASQSGNKRFGTVPGEAFDVTAGTDILPPLDETLVGELLDDATFTSALAMNWKPGAVAPTTNARFHVVPHKWLGTIVGNDRHSCTNCHSSTQASSRKFGTPGVYGWVRGNAGRKDTGGGIFSFLPFDLKNFGTTDFRPKPRKAFVESGIVAEYDKSLHPEKVYTILQPDNLKAKRK